MPEQMTLDRTKESPETVGPIHNDQQETMFDTELSCAVDDMVLAIRQKARARENYDKCENDLIEQMLKQKPPLRKLNFDGGCIEMQHQESKEKIKVKFEAEG